MSSFKLFHLPRLAFEHIIRLMVIQNVFCLSCCSKTVAKILKDMKMEVEAVVIYYGYHISLQIKRTYHETCFVDMKEVDNIKYIESAKSRLRHDKYGSLKYLTMNRFEDLIRFSDHVQSIFNIRYFEITVNSRDQGKKQMRHFLWIALAKKYDCVSILGLESIPFRFFNYLMKTVNLNASLRIECIVPAHCQHENKLKFKSIDYSRAEWVTLDDLKSFRNQDSVTLEDTNLTSEDFHKFLRFWINCEYDMMECLSVKLSGGTTIDKNTVLDGISRVVIKEQSEDDRHYILSRRHPEKKFTIGEIKLKGGMMQLTGYEPSEISPNTISCLECLEKKDSLKKEKIEVERDETAFAKNWTQYSVGDFDRVIKKMRTRKEDIDKELEAIQQNIVRLGFVDID